jgi:zinc protease
MKRALFAAAALFAVAAAPVAHAAAMPDVKSWTLPNGLNVLFLADHKAPVVTVQVFYHAGGKDEPADKRGMAHMFEHMMFKGSKFVAPEEHARFIDAVGGNENAFTQDDATGYHQSVPPSALDFTLKLEAERMRNLVLIQKTIDSEREVVKEELRASLENSPIQKALDKLLHLAYTVHPYRQSPIGEKKMLDTVTVEDCKKFYDEYYRPNNATLIVVGDTDEANVRALVEKNFGPLEKGPEIKRQHTVEPPQTALRDETLTMPVSLPILIGAYHIPDGASEDRYPLEVLQQVLSGGESSRLYQRLVHHDKSAVYAGGVLFAHEEPGLFITYGVYTPGSDPAKVKAALADEIAKIAAKPVTPHELEKAKNQLAAGSVFARERVSGLATEMGIDGVVAHDPLRGWKSADKYDAVTAADLQRVAKSYLTNANLTVVTLVPAGGGK